MLNSRSQITKLQSLPRETFSSYALALWLWFSLLNTASAYNVCGSQGVTLCYQWAVSWSGRMRMRPHVSDVISIRMKIILTSEFFDVIGWNTHTSGESRTTRPTRVMIEMANHTVVNAFPPWSTANCINTESAFSLSLRPSCGMGYHSN